VIGIEGQIAEQEMTAAAADYCWKSVAVVCNNSRHSQLLGSDGCNDVVEFDGLN
jgi:hypothetical protein